MLDNTLDHLIEIQNSSAIFTFTFTIFPHTPLSLIHTDACTHTKLTHTHTHLRPYVAWALPGKVIAREKKLWRVSYLFRCHWGAPLLSPSLSLYHFPLSSPLSLCLPLSCSHLLSQIMLASSGIQTVQGQSRDTLGAMDCPSVCFVCAQKQVREREGLMLSLWSGSPLVLTDRSPVPLRLTPWCYITHTHRQRKHTFQAAKDAHNNAVQGLLLSRSRPCV